MSAYVSLFDAFWKSFDAALILAGIWWALQPNSLTELPGSMTMSEGCVERLGVPREFADRLLATNTLRENLAYPLLLLRFVGVAFVVAGSIGVALTVDQAMLLSALAAISVALLAVAFVRVRRTTASRAALLTGKTRGILPWWLLTVYLIEALAELSVGSQPSIAAAFATVIGTACLALLAWQPVVLSGADIELERQVDRRFRLGHLITLAMFSELPSLVWAIDPDDLTLWPTIARMVVSIVFLLIGVYSVASVRRSNFDLRQVVESIP